MSESAPPGQHSVSPPPVAGRRSPLGVIFLTLFLDLAGFSIIFPLSPSLLEHYLGREGPEGFLGGIIALLESASPLARKDPIYTAALFGGLLGSIYSLLQFVFSPIWGSLSDRTGRRPILMVSTCGVALSYLLWAVSGSFGLFIFSRFLAGAMGGNISVATAAAADSSGPRDRAKAMGIVGAAFGLGFIFGPVIGGLLSGFDLSKVFPALAAYGFNPFSAAALGAFTLAVLNFLWVATRFQETLRPEARGERAHRSINPARLFQRLGLPGVWSANLIYFIHLLAFGGMEFTLTFLAHERFAYTPRQNVYLFIFAGVVMALVQAGLVRRLAPRMGERRLVTAGLVTVAPGFILMGLAGSIPLFYLGLFFMAVGSGLVNPSLTALVSLYTPPDRQGKVLGIFRSIGSLSRIVGPIFATLLFFRFGSACPYLVGAAILLPPFLLSLRLPEPARPER